MQRPEKRAVGDGRVSKVTRRLLAAWSDLVGMDIAGQALRQLAAAEAAQ